MFRGAGASVLTETSFNMFNMFKGLLSTGFSTTRSFVLEPISKVGLFVSRRFIFYMYKSVSKLADRLESIRYSLNVNE